MEIVLPFTAWGLHLDSGAGDPVGQGPLTTGCSFVAMVILSLACSAGPLSAREYRSHAVTREFQREHPCPSTGQTSGACPGYRKDHVVPLACGGPDAVTNLQWQTVPDARAKDVWERRACAR